MYLVVVLKDSVYTTVTTQVGMAYTISVKGNISVNAVIKDNIKLVAKMDSTLENKLLVKESARFANDSYVSSKVSEAEAMTAASFANEPVNVFVKDYYYDSVSDTIKWVDTTLYSGAHYQAKVVEEGDTQIARIVAEGDVQVIRVTTEGDTQVTRVIGYVDAAEDFSGDALAASLTADAWANTSANTDVIRYSWDPINDVIIETPLLDERSSYHWMEQAKLVAAGLSYQDVWAMDAVCTLPAAGTEDGQFYIINQVDPACTSYAVGDWLIWSSGVWHGIGWAFSWTTISDVLVEGLSPAVGDNLARVGSSYLKAEQDVIDAAQDALIVSKVPLDGTTPMSGSLQMDADELGVVDKDANSLVKAKPLGAVEVGNAVGGLTLKSLADILMQVGSDAEDTVAGKNWSRGLFATKNEAMLLSLWAKVGQPGTGVTHYGNTPPIGAVEMNGQALSKELFPRLYEAVGDLWATSGGQPYPAEGFFRVPISEAGGRGVFERARTQANGVGAYENDDFRSHSHPYSRPSYTSGMGGGNGNAISISTVETSTEGGVETRPLNIAVMKCIWTGSLNYEKQYENNALIGNALVLDGWANTAKHENNDFATEGVSDGFGVIVVYENTDLAGKALLMIGFGSYVYYYNTDLQANGYVSDGFGLSALYDNTSFSTNEAFNDGFTY